MTKKTDEQASPLVMRGICKRFGWPRRRAQSVLEQVDLEVPRGAVAVLLGANGVGKSTLLRIAHGRCLPEAGEVRVFGVDPFRRVDDVLRRVGIVPDAPDAPGWMRVGDAVKFCSAHYETWNQDETERRIELLEIPRQTRMRKMSRGQAAKVMLVLALGHEPDLVLLDEPFGRLDPLAREDVLRSIIGELRDGGRTVLCATHELELAARIADHVTILDGGRVTASGPLAAVLGEDEPSDVPRRLRETMRAARTETERQGSVTPC